MVWVDAEKFLTRGLLWCVFTHLNERNWLLLDRWRAEQVLTCLLPTSNRILKTSSGPYWYTRLLVGAKAKMRYKCWHIRCKRWGISMQHAHILSTRPPERLSASARSLWRKFILEVNSSRHHLIASHVSQQPPPRTKHRAECALVRSHCARSLSALVCDIHSASTSKI